MFSMHSHSIYDKTVSSSHLFFASRTTLRYVYELWLWLECVQLFGTRSRDWSSLANWNFWSYAGSKLPYYSCCYGFIWLMYWLNSAIAQMAKHTIFHLGLILTEGMASSCLAKPTIKPVLAFTLYCYTWGTWSDQSLAQHRVLLFA